MSTNHAAPKTGGESRKRRKLRVAIVGGGKGCLEFLTMIANDQRYQLNMSVVGVADTRPDAPGMQFARRWGVELLAEDHREFFKRPDIDLIIEITGRQDVCEEIYRTKPPNMHFIDHVGARVFWDFFRLVEERERMEHQAKLRTERERRRIKQIFDSLPYEILVINQDFVVELANETLLKNNDLREAEVVGRYCYEVEHRTKGPCEMGDCPYEELLQKGKTAKAIHTTRTKGGKEIFSVVRAVPLMDETGRRIGVVESTMDITDRIELEQELKETRSRLDQFLESAPFLVFMKDLLGRYIMINKHGLARLGKTEAEVLGKPDSELFGEDIAKKFQERDAQVLKQKKQITTQDVIEVEGKTVYYQMVLFPVFNHKNEIIAYCGIGQDVTELKLFAEELFAKSSELKETREYLERILESSKDLIYTTDLDGRIVTCNRGTENALGYSREEMKGLQVKEFTQSPETFQRLLDQTIREESVVGDEILFTHKEGGTVYVSTSLTCLYDRSGNVVEIIGIGRDITTRRKLQEDLIQSDRLAAIGKMAAGVAHEINNPLAIINEKAGWMADLLQDAAGLARDDRKEFEESIGGIFDQTERCRTITHSLLGFVRRTAGDHRACDVHELLDECVKLLQAELRPTSIMVERQYGTDIPKLVSDPMQLEQVFVNLMKNGIDAIEEKGTSGGRITLGTRASPDHVEVSVTDDGVGISEENLGKVYDLFYTSKPAGKGTGLGLSICRNILKKLGGSIELQSHAGRGTTVTVRVPTGRLQS